MASPRDLPLRSGALFVDFENVFYALLNGTFKLTEDAALAVALDGLFALRQKLRDGGATLVVERSYADWEQMPSSAQRQLQIAGILPRFTDSRRNKNTADIELSLDTLAHVVTRSDLSDFAIVGGDRDYLPVLRRLKEHGRRVTVAALRDTLAGDVREFLKSWSEAEIVELDALFKLPPSAAVPKEKPQPGATPRAEVRVVRDQMMNAILRFPIEAKLREVHLGRFLRWPDSDPGFDLVSQKERRRLIDELVAEGVLSIEDRDGGWGNRVSILRVDWNNPLTQKLNG